VHKLIHSI